MTQNPFSRFPPEPGPVVRPVHPGVPDPGTPGMAWLAGLIAAICFGALVFLNQASTGSSSTQKAAKAVGHQVVVDISDPFTLAAKMVMKLAYLIDAKDKQTRETLLAQSEGQIKDQSKRPETERVREAIMHADILGTEDGRAAAENLFVQMESEFADRTNRTEHAIDDDEAARIAAAKADIATLRQIYAGEGESVPAADRERLIVRHAWFGEVAFTFGKPHEDPKRAELFAGAVALMLTLFAIVAIGLLAAVGGTGCFVVMAVLILTGKIKRRFVAPATGGSFGWEILAAFLLAFLGLRAISAIVIHFCGTALPSGELQPPTWFGYFALGGQWFVALAIFFPILRGVSFAEFRRLAGWTAPKGIFREIGAGIFGYLAGLPLLFAVAIATVWINSQYMKFTGQEKAQESPILELVSKGSPVFIALLFTLAVIWAPIVEETVIRGGLYRALRGRLPMIFAAIVSAVVFGFLHSYFVLLLGPVITIGFIFALIREWRGSIIGPMAAHALNNLTVLGMVFFLFKSIG